MKKLVLIFAAAVAIFNLATAQNKLLTVDECILKQRTTLAPRKLVQLQWIKGTDDFCYVDTAKSKNILMKGHATDKDLVEYVALADINAALLEQKLEAQKKFPVITWVNPVQFRFNVGERECTYDVVNKKLDSKDLPRLEDAADHKDEHPATRMIAYTIDNNLYIFDGQKKLVVTNDAEKNIVNGQSVHRDEFGITKGTYWSPNGTYLAFYRMDQTMVTDYPVTDFTKHPAEAKLIKYPMAGAKSHQVTLGIYEVASGKKWFIKTTGDPEHYLTNVAWSPDEKKIYIAELNRDQNFMQLNCYDAVSGAFEKTLLKKRVKNMCIRLIPCCL